MTRIRKHLSPALVLSVIAIFIALGGGAYAALGKNSVGSKQLKTNAVTAKKIKKNSITTSKIKNDNVTGAKVKESTLATVPSATAANSATTATTADNTKGYSTFKQTRFAATGAPTYDAARDAAVKHVLFTAGPITVYTKCFTNTTIPRTESVIYAETTENGVLMGSGEDDLEGNPFLDTSTAEDDRELLAADAAPNNTAVNLDSSYSATFMTPSGTAFEARLENAAKNGTVTGGNGVYGDGDVCLVTGAFTQFTG